MPDTSFEIKKLAKLLDEAHIPYELFSLPSFAGDPVPMVLRYFGDREKEGFGLTASGWKCSVINNGYGSDKGLLEISCHRDLLTEEELNENKQDVIGNLTADDVYQRIHDDWTRMRIHKNIGMEDFPADEVVLFSAETPHEEFREIHPDFELTAAQFFSVFAESHEGDSTLSSKERIDRYLFPSSDAAWELSASIYERKLLPLFSNYGCLQRRCSVGRINQCVFVVLAEKKTNAVAAQTNAVTA